MSISGFACRSCNFQLLLSDVSVRRRIVKCFKDGAGSASIPCSGCGREHDYSYFDLKVFPPPGQQISAAKVTENTLSFFSDNESSAN